MLNTRLLTSINLKTTLLLDDLGCFRWPRKSLRLVVVLDAHGEAVEDDGDADGEEEAVVGDKTEEEGPHRRPAWPQSGKLASTSKVNNFIY